MSELHLEWIKATPKNSGKSALFNECKKCKTKETPKKVLFCTKCGDTLNRPHVIEKGKPRPVDTEHETCYKRIPPNEPAKTLTQNSGVYSSDNNGHYCENRVLSLREILILATFFNIPRVEGLFEGTEFEWDGEYDFSSQMPTKESYRIQKNIIRQAIGESIPPLAMMRMIKSLTQDWPN